MPTLPQLIEEDIDALHRALEELLAQSEATVALVIDKGGFLIAECPPGSHFDTTTLSALGAGSFAATQSLAELVSEKDFTSMYQQGDTNSLLIMNVDEYCLLTVIFPARISVGAVKYFAIDAAQQIARQLALAHKRAPGAGFDLSLLNLPDSQSLFRKKSA
ncbi:MAG: roadblock/LC7 domain-containing protein [Verrucomicrobia bacterium]|nr:roadblock/LC7 domain-containing protein [Verrucomicrobiota bacterium]